MLLGFFVLILLTTVSAGIPAYLLTRAQLEQQALSQLDGARRATLSLFSAELSQLHDLVTLFTERPTLQRLVSERAVADLQAYLENFRQQTSLDLLLLCDPASEPLAGNMPASACASPPMNGFTRIDDRPAIIASQQVRLEQSGELAGMAVAGIWLDQAFLRQLASDTGVQQSILDSSGLRLASSLGAINGQQAAVDRADLMATSPGAVDLAGGRYLVSYSPLPGAADGAMMVSEVALPVDALTATENQALLILAGSTALVAILGGFLGVWFLRQLVAPLQQLTEAAEQVSQGDLMAPIPLVAGPDEISTLATALHRSQASMLQALQERSQARDWLDSLVHSVVEGVVTVDNGGKITFFSQGAEGLSGWTREEALSMHLDTVFPLVDNDREGFLAQVPVKGAKWQIAVRHRRGAPMVLAVTAARMIPPGGEKSQLALVLRDVTQEEALRHLRTYFLANISHEFRTPLSTLKASLELLLDPEEDLSAKEMRELLKPTYLSLGALQTLIDNLLESSTIEAGHFVIQKRPTDLNQVLEDALRMVAPLLERRNQPVAVGEPGSLPVIPADAARLTRVLVNLLANASKYSPAESSIDVEVTRKDDVLHIAVADRGPGIPPAERGNVFRRFVRGKTSNGEQYGVGLGLYVVKTIVEAHGGHVGVTDRSGGGSLFWFELPLDAGENE